MNLVWILAETSLTVLILFGGIGKSGIQDGMNTNGLCLPTSQFLHVCVCGGRPMMRGRVSHDKIYFLQKKNQGRDEH